ncbi:MAG: hypothetical protein JO102_07540, partial [Elusimicrobia bacterium]|nr:hypothetical protein [Elusimicrobiota bacterium]
MFLAALTAATAALAAPAEANLWGDRHRAASLSKPTFTDVRPPAPSTRPTALDAVGFHLSAADASIRRIRLPAGTPTRWVIHIQDIHRNA